MSAVNYRMYREKLVLAPMVRVTKLPMRLLALDYGADLVYCEEVIDFKMLQSRKVENEQLGTIDFLMSDNTVAFRTCPAEKHKLVFQMGTSNAKRALKVAKMVESYVAAIDINMGCPKEFSTKEGMGASLLDHPETYTEILTTLVKFLSIPVTCKIRIKPKLSDTLEMVKKIEATGVSAIGVHGRTRHERPKDDNHDDVIRCISSSVSVPIIANGGSSNINSYNDVMAFKSSTSAASVMLARAAMHNVSIFRKEGLLSVEKVIHDFMKYAIRYDSHPMHVKYVLQNILHQQLNSPIGQLLLAAKNNSDICSLCGLEDLYNETQRQRSQMIPKTNINDSNNNNNNNVNNNKNNNNVLGVGYRVEVNEEGCKTHLVDYKYDRADTQKLTRSKMELYNWTVSNKIPPPSYTTVLHPTERSYRSIVKVNDHNFSSTIWNKSDKFSQRSSAFVCLALIPTLFNNTTNYAIFGTNNNIDNNNNLNNNKVNTVNSEPSIKNNIKGDNITTKNNSNNNVVGNNNDGDDSSDIKPNYTDSSEQPRIKIIKLT